MWYIEDNRWFITWSKMKLFFNSSEAYFKVYVQEIDTSFVKESDAFAKWTMIDKYILTKDEFNESYAMPIWLKKDLIEECRKRNIPVDSKDWVKELQAKLFWNKEVITDWEKEMLEWIEREVKRQPLFDYYWQYECQKEIIAEYRWMKLKWKLDRFSLDKKLIRDLKSTWDVKFNKRKWMTVFEDSLIQNDEYMYWFQMARYRILVKVKYWIECDCIIDAVNKTWNYASESYLYHKDTIRKIANEIVFPILDKLIDAHESNDFTDNQVTREQLLDNRYYPVLEWWIQKEFKVIEPAFY